MAKISKLLTVEISTLEGLPNDLTNHDLLHYKDTSITSIDVDCFFAHYKNLLTEN